MASAEDVSKTTATGTTFVNEILMLSHSVNYVIMCTLRKSYIRTVKYARTTFYARCIGVIRTYYAYAT